MFITSICMPYFKGIAQAADSGKIIFGWQQAKISQSVGDINTVGKTSVAFSVSAAEFQDWKTSADEINIGIELYGSGGGLIYQHSTGINYVDANAFNDYSLIINAADVSGWDQIDTISAFIIGKDGEFWAGNYGTQIESASLKFNDGVELLVNTQFTQNYSGWTSDIGWQQCSGTGGGLPCLSAAPVTTTTTIPVNNSQYTLNDYMVWGIANEGWDLTLTAPDGGIFSEVVFASYGNPDGSSGLFTQQWCHATNSIQKVTETFISNSSATIASNNAVFGDPCGGTYKRLVVVLRYTGGLPNTTTTTTTIPPPPPTCGPYENITITGSETGGLVWGSGPYTDDSDMSVAAVHSGLVVPGQTKTLVPVNAAYHSSYPGSTANGITTRDWLSGWCGYDLILLPSPTTTTTIPTTTTEAPSTTAPIFVNPFTTTTSTVVGPVITQNTINETTTTVQSTTTTSTTTTTTTLPPIEEKIPVPAVEDIEKIETKEELQKLVETVDLKNIEPDQAVALVSNKAFMELPTEQLEEVFDSIPVNELTEEQESQLVETLTSAPDEVKNTFEALVDVYASGLDDYVAVGSSIDVGTRRSLIAATAVLSTVAAVPASGAGSGGGSSGPTPKTGGSGGGSSGGSGSGPGESGSSGRKEDDPEEEEEESVEIEGPEGDEEEGNFTKNSIFKYEEGTMKKRFSLWGFIKKFSRETAAMAFTISGSVVVFATLSGETRKITLIATSAAFVVHYVNAMLKNDEE